MGGYPPPHSGRNSTNFPPKTAFFAQKTLFLGLFLTKKNLTERGGTPPPPIADGFFLKTNGKKLAERGGTPSPSLRTIPVTRVFEPLPYVRMVRPMCSMKSVVPTKIYFHHQN